MTAKRYVYPRPDGTVVVMQPAYLDLARPLADPGATLRRTGAGWSMRLSSGDRVTEADGLVVTDTDILLDGESVYATTAADRERSAFLSCGAFPDDRELGANVYEVEAGQVPTSSEWCDAWAWDGTSVVVDLPRARHVHMERIRDARDAALEKLDVPFMRAVEAGDAAEQRRVAAEKQTLRDIPQTFDLDGYATPEALGAAWPDGLARP